jgi:hypothetical protein
VDHQAGEITLGTLVTREAEGMGVGEVTLGTLVTLGARSFQPGGGHQLGGVTLGTLVTLGATGDEGVTTGPCARMGSVLASVRQTAAPSSHVQPGRFPEVVMAGLLCTQEERDARQAIVGFPFEPGGSDKLIPLTSGPVERAAKVVPTANGVITGGGLSRNRAHVPHGGLFVNDFHALLIFERQLITHP